MLADVRPLHLWQISDERRQELVTKATAAAQRCAEDPQQPGLAEHLSGLAALCADATSRRALLAACPDVLSTAAKTAKQWFLPFIADEPLGLLAKRHCASALVCINILAVYASGLDNSEAVVSVLDGELVNGLLRTILALCERLSREQQEGGEQDASDKGAAGGGKDDGYTQLAACLWLLSASTHRAPTVRDWVRRGQVPTGLTLPPLRDVCQALMRTIMTAEKAAHKALVVHGMACILTLASDSKLSARLFDDANVRGLFGTYGELGSAIESQGGGQGGSGGGQEGATAAYDQSKQLLLYRSAGALLRDVASRPDFLKRVESLDGIEGVLIGLWDTAVRQYEKRLWEPLAVTQTLMADLAHKSSSVSISLKGLSRGNGRVESVRLVSLMDSCLSPHPEVAVESCRLIQALARGGPRGFDPLSLTDDSRQSFITSAARAAGIHVPQNDTKPKPKQTPTKPKPKGGRSSSPPKRVLYPSLESPPDGQRASPTPQPADDTLRDNDMEVDVAGVGEGGPHRDMGARVAIARLLFDMLAWGDFIQHTIQILGKCAFTDEIKSASASGASSVALSLLVLAVETAMAQTPPATPDALALLEVFHHPPTLQYVSAALLGSDTQCAIKEALWSTHRIIDLAERVSKESCSTRLSPKRSAAAAAVAKSPPAPRGADRASVYSFPSRVYEGLDVTGIVEALSRDSWRAKMDLKREKERREAAEIQAAETDKMVEMQAARHQRAVEKLQQDIATLKEAVRRAQEDKQTHAASESVELLEAHRQLEEMTAIIRRKDLCLKNAQSSLDEVRSTLDITEQEGAELRRVRGHLEETTRHQAHTIASLEQRLKVSSHERVEALQRVETALKEQGEMKVKLERTNNALQDHVQERDKTYKRLMMIAREHQRLLERNESLEQEIKDNSRATAGGRQALQDKIRLEGMLAECEYQQSALRQQVALKHKEAHTATEEAAAVKGRLVQTKRECDALCARVRDLESECQGKDEAMQELHAKVDRLETELAGERRRMQEIHQFFTNRQET
ncbi:unnamed protein product [Vitrella brassicaformis CCMP3155]|uniref:Uncharacterized protein n=4 Tax=Vitrella brassicaformis TaxID=1169539 RepID=A0A0G4ED26_VITBC|nr:unnamed protein product [Vitrella brassicaformis CCMP3155]|eukprot:CEL93247.1 unnamed protein product [Vitrella brassicaformis CCMP3155]